jgi:hypothetical protein
MKYQFIKKESLILAHNSRSFRLLSTGPVALRPVAKHDGREQLVHQAGLLEVARKRSRKYIPIVPFESIPLRT